MSVVAPWIPEDPDLEADVRQFLAAKRTGKLTLYITEGVITSFDLSRSARLPRQGTSTASERTCATGGK